MARLVLPQGALGKPVPNRALIDVTVKVIGKAKPSQTSQRLVESIDTARSSKSDEVLAAQLLQSGYILVTTYSHEKNNLIEPEEG